MAQEVGTVLRREQSTRLPRAFHSPPRGLGIRVVRDLVRGLGGRIAAPAVSNHGSRIAVTLPSSGETRPQIMAGGPPS
jgi:signal transduction histidine kinase